MPKTSSFLMAVACCIAVGAAIKGFLVPAAIVITAQLVVLVIWAIDRRTQN